MPKVVGVRLRYSKTLWFDPADLDPQNGDLVLVKTERGTELGIVHHSTQEVDAKKLPAELKPVVRIANDEDIQKAVELSEQEKNAFPSYVDLIKSNKLDMNPIDVEFVFSGEMIVFYFSADERIDFRNLVKDLASHFRQRIDMRQIGVRDEARRVGGIGHCGQELCCSRLGGEFAPVAVKMAKDQGLPLNPAKISGLCGRLMCCLRYEVEAYKDFNSRSPKRNDQISTPRGGGKVIDRDALRELITLQFQKDEGGWERLVVPLGSISCCKTREKGQGACPCHISEEDFDALTPDDPAAEQAFAPLDELKFKSDSKNNKKDGKSSGSDSAKPREGSSKKRPSRRRGKKESSGTQKGPEASQGQKPAAQKPVDGKANQGAAKPRRRPNRKPSQGGQQRTPEPPKNSDAPSKPAAGERIPRRRRRED